MDEISDLFNKWIVRRYVTLDAFIDLLVGIDLELGVYVGVDDDIDKANEQQDMYDLNHAEIKGLFGRWMASKPYNFVYNPNETIDITLLLRGFYKRGWHLFLKNIHVRNFLDSNQHLFLVENPKTLEHTTTLMLNAYNLNNNSDEDIYRQREANFNELRKQGLINLDSMMIEGSLTLKILET
ncbi:MAG: hypothetical protein ABL903_18465 [Methylococcales bacterium]